MSWFYIFQIAEWVIALAMVLVILRRRFAPVTGLAWLSLVFFLPILGAIVYFLVGDARLGRRRVRRHRAVVHLSRSNPRLAELRSHVIGPPVDYVQMRVMVQAEKISGMPILGGNSVELMASSDQVLDRLLEDIARAQHHVHLLFYIFECDQTGWRTARALAEAAKRGVRCRVLADAAGSRGFFGRSGIGGWLTDHGVEVNACLPVAPLRRRLERLDLRNHRKLAVVDGQVAYTGSQNIVDAQYGHKKAGQWIDLMARFTGPIVSQLQVVFLEDWSFETQEDLDEPELFPPLSAAGDIAAQVVATGPSQETESLSRVILAAIYGAQRKLIISSPYLIPDEPIVMALTMAADRGVDVNLVLPERSDHVLVSAAGRAYYGPLLDAGINIYVHQRGMLHAKTMTVDDAFAFLGSANLDIRSFYLNFELNVLMYGPEITRELRFAQMRYISESRALDADQWRRRPAAKQYLDSAAALLSPLL